MIKFFNLHLSSHFSISGSGLEVYKAIAFQTILEDDGSTSVKTMKLVLISVKNRNHLLVFDQEHFRLIDIVEFEKWICISMDAGSKAELERAISGAVRFS